MPVRSLTCRLKCSLLGRNERLSGIHTQVERPTAHLGSDVLHYVVVRLDGQ